MRVLIFAIRFMVVSCGLLAVVANFIKFSTEEGFLNHVRNLLAGIACLGAVYFAVTW